MRVRIKRIFTAIGIATVSGLVVGVILVRLDPALKAYFFPSPKRLVYSLSIQKMRAGQPFGDPFKSSGAEIFQNGDRFRFNLISPENGFFYLFNEGIADDGNTYFNILYPTPRRNNGSAEVAANQYVETSENEFGGLTNTERLWIIWSPRQLPDIESAKTAAFATSGKIIDQIESQNLRTFLEQHSQKTPQVLRDGDGKQSALISNDEVIVSLLHLEHR